MPDWKSTHGVTDEGASRAGVYGTPNSTWDIARAQEETMKAQQARSASYAPPYSPAVYQYPTAQPLPLGTMSESKGCLMMLAGLVFCAVVIIGGFAWNASDRARRAANQSAIYDATSGPTFDVSHYAALSREALALSSTPASTLYARTLIGSAGQWSALNKDQRVAVQAAWLRYARNPKSFRRLVPQQQAYFDKAFVSYLTDLKATGDPVASADLETLSKRLRTR